MNAFWEGFEKRAGKAKAVGGFLDSVVPHAKQMWQHAKPILKNTGQQVKTLAAKGRDEVMKNPQRALVGGAVGGALGTYAMTRPRQPQYAYGSQAGYY